jgi:hypothetical protein
MARKYNYLFSSLVKDKSDIQGHIAYAIYKFDKISYLDKFKKDKGREPTENEIEAFNSSCCTEARIEEYRQHADSILHDFTNNVLADATSQIEADYQNKQEEHLRKVIRETQPSLKAQYFHGVIQSVLGAIALALLIWIFVSIVNRYDIGNLHIYLEKPNTELR